MLDDTTAQVPPPPPLPSSEQRARPIAHWTHTLALVLVLAGTATLARLRGASAHTSDPRLLRYTSTIVMEWLLLGAVIAGIYNRRRFLMNAFANRSRSLSYSFGLGLAVYMLGFMSIILVGGALYFTPLFHKSNEAVVLAMAPQTLIEFVIWFFVSASAGVCEELIFRGYLLQQVTAWTKRPTIAIVAVGALFGCVHLYEGASAVVALAALGMVYGFVVRYYKGDLRAVIIAHTLQDFVVAFILLAKSWLERHQPHL